MRYSLAELGIEVNLKYDYAIRRMKDYKSEFGGTHMRINIEYDNNITLPEYEEQIPFQWRFYWLRFKDGSVGAIRTLINSDYIIYYARWNKDATKVTLKIADVTHVGGLSTDFREYAYLGELLHILLPFHDRLILHSSAISLDNHGVAFSANSGVGKSTHVNTWKKLFPSCSVINDDEPILYNPGDGYKLYGSPWSGKSEINSNISAPLDAIVCLARDDKNHIEKISPRLSLPFILKQTRPTPLNEREDLKLNIISDILTTTNIYMLGCLPDDEAAAICKEKIWKEMRII